MSPTAPAPALPAVCHGRDPRPDPAPGEPRPPATRLGIEIRGAVQGVGFRPFVYRLARDLGLPGWVLNDARGVFLEVEGQRAVLETFLHRLRHEVPPRARIHRLESRWLPTAGLTGFTIRESAGTGSKRAVVLPDVATCPACRAEVLDPDDRRHGYPFTNCTDCGPRFTIVRALPYDRPHTTMAGFAMCPNCRQEYTEPLDRRFHAQPNACPQCGPRLALWDRGGAAVEATGGFEGAEGSEALLRRTAEALAAGEIVAVQGLGGFHLVVDAANATAVAELRRRKVRRDKPLAVMVPDLGTARRLCEVDDAAADLLAGAEAPIVLLPRRRGRSGSVAAPDTGEIAEGVAPGCPELGLMLPYTPLHHLLMRHFGRPLVATSGNLSEEPIVIDPAEVVERLGGIADRFLVHDRPIARHADDSVARVLAGAPRLLRRARGYAPLPVPLAAPAGAGGREAADDAPTLVAVGAHLKGTVALGLGDQVFLSQHLGDLDNLRTQHAFERAVTDFLELWEARPVALVHDLHPDYPSTRWAEAAAAGSRGDEAPRVLASLAGLPRIAVQHHHAHLAACIAEAQAEAAQGAEARREAEAAGEVRDGETVEVGEMIRGQAETAPRGAGRSALAEPVAGPVLGFTWDGTGYGPDGTIWGGEALLGDAAGFERVARLRPFRLPGGDAAVREPRRSALALVTALRDGGEKVLAGDLDPLLDAVLDRLFTAAERRPLERMLASGFNAPVTTSAGRLFDGVAALAGLHPRATFEGQAALALEAALLTDPAEAARREDYPLPVTRRAATPPATEPEPTAAPTFAHPAGDPLPSGTSPAVLSLAAPRPADSGPVGPRPAGWRGERELFEIDWRPLVAAVVRDAAAGASPAAIAGRFHRALAAAQVEVARRLAGRLDPRRPTVALTGGCFQNRPLVEASKAALEDAGFRVLLHRQVPPNDGGIAFGQVAVARAVLAAARPAEPASRSAASDPPRRLPSGAAPSGGNAPCA